MGTKIVVQSLAPAPHIEPVYQTIMIGAARIIEYTERTYKYDNANITVISAYAVSLFFQDSIQRHSWKSKLGTVGLSLANQ